MKKVTACIFGMLLVAVVVTAQPTTEVDVYEPYYVIEQESSTWASSPAIQQWDVWPLQYYLYHNKGDEVWVSSTSTFKERGPYLNDTRLIRVGNSSSDHAYAGNLCSGAENNYWGLGGHTFRTGNVIPTPAPKVMLSMNHTCDILPGDPDYPDHPDSHQHHFFYTFAYRGQLMQTSYANLYLNLEDLAEHVSAWAPVPFRLSSLDPSSGGPFGFLFTFYYSDAATDGDPTTLPGWWTGFGVHYPASNKTVVMTYNESGGARSNPANWTWTATTSTSGYRLPPTAKLANFGYNLGGLVATAQTTNLDDRRPPYYYVTLLVSSPFGSSCEHDAHATDIRVNGYKLQVDSSYLVHKKRLRYPFEYTGTCSDPLCSRLPAATKNDSGKGIFWVEAHTCQQYAGRIMYARVGQAPWGF